jgi:hypothetical protein
MKKSVIFLINGLGIEKPGSYSISIDQCMPNLARTKETSYYTSAFIKSLEYRSAYQNFYLGDTYKKELNYIREHVLNQNLNNNPTYQKFVNDACREEGKIHIFVEPTTDKVVEEINQLINTLTLNKNKQVFLHLILSQQTVNEYGSLITIINYIKYHINEHITVGFIIGKEFLSDNLTKEELSFMKKLFFYCSAERWSETDKKLNSLKETNVRPCLSPGFCAVNTCNITNNDVIMFFNTKRDNYDKFIRSIYENASEVFRTSEFNLPIYSILKLDSQYQVNYFIENVVYEDSLAAILKKANKKALIITSEENINLLNFYANGYNHVNNPDIAFMKIDFNFLDSVMNVCNLIDNSIYDLIIFDFHMMVDKTINDLKDYLEHLDKILGYVADACVNKHSLFISSLYGLKKTLPIANYNTEEVTIDYEMQIPIFFFDYSYPRSKYILIPGETNDILSTAIRCIWDDNSLISLIKVKGLINNLFGKK